MTKDIEIDKYPSILIYSSGKVSGLIYRINEDIKNCSFLSLIVDFIYQIQKGIETKSKEQNNRILQEHSFPKNNPIPNPNNPLENSISL